MSEKKEEWKECKDPKSGKTYYYNRVTKKTQWTKPIPAEDGAAAGDAATAVGAASDPDNWRTRVDKTRDKSYYYNKVTKETTWTKPACLDGVEPKQSTATAVSTEPAKAEKQWREVTDIKSGRTYWYDKVTKQTTWTDPNKKVAGEKESAGADSAAADSDPAELEKSQTAQQMLKLKQRMQENAENEIAETETGNEESEDLAFIFAKHRHGFWNRKLRMGEVQGDSKLMTFKKSLIKKALLKKNRDLDMEAVQSFKNVMSYMGDRKSSKPAIEHAKKLLRNIMFLPIGIRDELYMQICKQTTQNPRIASAIKGWELMVFCVATFPPSKQLKTYLLDFITKAIEENIDPKITALAEVAKTNLPKIILMGHRKQVPSKLELESLINSKPVAIQVNLCNDTFKTLATDSYTLVKDIEDELVKKYNLTCRSPFAMYERAGANVERILSPDDRILDILASWENRGYKDEVEVVEKKSSRRSKFDNHKDANKQVQKVVLEYNSFLYKAKLVLKMDNGEIMGDPEAVNLIYVQATQDVITERYPFAEKDITVIAALQLQATFGNYSPEVHQQGWLAPKITEYIPRSLISIKGMVNENKVKEWECKILSKYQKVTDFTALDAKLNYLDYVQEWTFYGATFFTVEQRQFREYPSPLTLGINCEGVLLMHPENKTVLENYQFTDIVTWGHSDEKFIVVVGNILQQRKLIFKTSDGKHMNHLIHDYVKFKVKSIKK